MCTLAVAFSTDRRFPLVVAANRDEHLVRPAEGWALRENPHGNLSPLRRPEGAGRVAAPLDLSGGGTWIGVSPAGVFAALTNFHPPEGGWPDRRRRSRGELVLRALAAPDAPTAAEALSALDAGRYNPFHLVVADAARAFLWRYDGRRASLDPLAPGLHVVTERSGDGSDPRALRVRARWPLDPSVPALAALLALPEAPGEPAVCVHDSDTYGTRSAAILRLAGRLSESELFVADGPPCAAPFEDRGRLLSALARSA
ncbi:MAG TPA: NRDE family protein [Anaeromyxobacteraceae bacterium]|nr:NRDE family protein [Anaeromyxobacteraceae bacterium]